MEKTRQMIEESEAKNEQLAEQVLSSFPPSLMGICFVREGESLSTDIAKERDLLRLEPLLSPSAHLSPDDQRTERQRQPIPTIQVLFSLLFSSPMNIHRPSSLRLSRLVEATPLSPI